MPDRPGATSETGGRRPPDWTAHIRERLPASLRLSPTREREIVDELAQHLDDRWLELVAGGVSSDEAEALALAAFRDRDTLARLLAPLRQARTPRPLTVAAPRDGWLESLWRDTRYSARLLRRNPGFTIAALVTLALGLGANTAIFSLVDAVLLRTVPVERPHELVFFKTTATDGTGGTPPYPWFERVRENAATFTGMAVFAQDETRVELDGLVEQVLGQAVSGGYFDVLGIEPALGRLLRPDDESVAPTAAVIDYGYWQRRFGSDPRVVGRAIAIGDRPFTIVGVTPQEFSGLQPGRRVEVTTPIDRQWPVLRSSTASWSETVARLGAGVTIAQATAVADAAFQAHRQTMTGDDGHRSSRVDRVEAISAARGLNRLRQRYSTSLLALMGVAVTVLLIGCANLSTLLLVRTDARAREMAIRQAAGASTGALLRQMLVETLLVFALGATAGLVVAHASTSLLVGFFATGRNAIHLDAQVDWSAAAFAAGLSLVAAVLTGTWPALRAIHLDPQQALRSGDPRLHGARRARAATRLLIAGQTALGLTLLVAALLFATTMRNLRYVDLGFTPEHVLTQSLVPSQRGASEAETRARFWSAVLDRVQTLPGARATSLSVLTPMSGHDTGTVSIGSAREPAHTRERLVHVNHVSEDYFSVFGIRVVSGRLLRAADRSARVAIISERVQADWYPDRSALGQTLELGDGRRYLIVGVVPDTKHLSLREAAVRMVYLPLWQALDPPERVTLSVATPLAPMALADQIARQVRAVDPTTLVSDVFDVETQIDATLLAERLLAALGTAFALLALTLSAIGVYGVLSYSVAARRGEIALRLALGAEPSRVRWDVWRDVQWPVAIGIAAGLPVAWGASRLVHALFFGVTALDIGAYVLATVVLAAVAAGAAALPMRRAASLNPADVMRE